MNQDFGTKLGALLGSLRETAGLPQDVLASALGHSQAWVSRVESGGVGVSVEVLIRWLDALDVRLGDLATDIEALGRPELKVSIWEREP